MASAATSRPLHIFVVEDHRDSLKYLEVYLKQCGHCVHHARGEEEALRALRTEQPDVLLSDIGLPDGNGWDLLSKLRHENNAPKYAIAMSGFGTNSDIEKSTKAGFRRHLLKPLDPDELDAALEEAWSEIEKEEGAASGRRSEGREEGGRSQNQFGESAGCQPWSMGF